MTEITLTTSTPCVASAALFQHPVVEDGAAPTTPEHARLLVQAAEACAGCPMRAQCLFDAVVQHDVAGFVAGTTATQRRQIRARLGVKVAAENFDTLAGAPQANRPVDREEVLRLRRANPDETLDQIAMRLGCSTSTVKRHLRKERRGIAPRTAAAQPTGRRPSVQQVWLTALAVTGQRRSLVGVA